MMTCIESTAGQNYVHVNKSVYTLIQQELIHAFYFQQFEF